MFATLLVPDFQLQVVLRLRGGMLDHAAVLLDESETANSKQRGKAPVLQATPAALRAGVQPGMTATQAQARLAKLSLYYRDTGIEDHAQAQLLDIAAQFTPDYESTAPGVITMDWSGVNTRDRSILAEQPALPGMGAHAPMPAVNTTQKTHALTEAAQELLRQAGTTGLIVRVGVAENPDLAFLAACLADPIQVLDDNRTRTRAFLSPLPISVVQPPPDLLETFSLWGIRRLGQFTALPRDEVTKRLGTEAARLWDFADGTRRRLLRLVRIPEDYSQRIELEHPLESMTLLSHLLQRMLDTLTARLATAWLVAREIVLMLGFESGGVHPCTLRIAEPARDADLLLRLIQTHLEGFTSPSPITVVSLELKPARPGQNQGDLFEHSLRDPNRFAETLAQLEALLGPDKVGVPVLLPTHRPDAISMAPFLEREKIDAARDKGAASQAMPLRRFRPPLPAQVTLIDKHPSEIIAGPIHGKVLAHRGPWLMSGDWWDKQRWSREEWDIQLADGLLCRLKRERSAWSVEGLYA